jgi:predicted permease
VIAGWRRWRRIWQRTPERDVDAELQFHFDERIAELIAGGAEADHARAQALREFGDVSGVRHGLVDIDQRITRRRAWRERFDWVGQDLGYVLRSLRRSPGFVVAVVMTLALGIGANVAVLSVLDRLFLTAPPGIARPNEVRRIYRFYRVDNIPDHANARPLGDFSVFAFRDFRDIVAAAPSGLPLGGYARPQSDADIATTFVIGDYFKVLAVRPAVGRFFSSDESRIETDADVAVISHRLWRTQFGARTDIVGQPLRVDGHLYTVIGVTPGAFHGADNDANDIWLPISAMRWDEGNDADWYERPHAVAPINLIARIRTPAEGLLLQQAATQVFRRSDIKADINPVARLRPLLRASGPDADAGAVAMTTRLAGVSLIILLIACANVTNLLLARGMRRRAELALRLAMGISRYRLMSLLLTESVVVGLIGGAVALMLALMGGGALRRLLMPGTNWVDPIADWRVVALAVLLALAAGVGAGLIPSWRASRADAGITLRGGMREGLFQRSRLRTWLLLTQAALAVVLLAGAGLFVRSLHAMETTDVGYDADRLVFASVNADAGDRARQPAIWAALPRLAFELAALPGVERTALASNVPMASWWSMTVFLPTGDSVISSMSFVSPPYVGTMGLKLSRGRDFTARDSARPESAVLVNEFMARKLWPGRDPIGQCLIQSSRTSPCSTVVGVVSDAHEQGINERQAPKFFRPLADSGHWGVAHTIIFRTGAGQAALVADEVRRVLRDRFAGWAVPTVHTMVANMSWELRPRRTGAALFSAAGLLALLVAIVGVYSTIAYTFSQRTHEIGVRMALGARAVSVARLVIGDGLRVVAVGVVIGVLLSLASGQLVASMLYHVSPYDPAVLGTVSIVLLLAATLACAIPAWRASRVDPVIALRAE